MIKSFHVASFAGNFAGSLIDLGVIFNHIAPMSGKNRLVKSLLLMGLCIQASLGVCVNVATAHDWHVAPPPIKNGTLSGNALTRDTEVLTPQGILNDVDFLPAAITNIAPAAGPQAAQVAPVTAHAAVQAVLSPTNAPAVTLQVQPALPVSQTANALQTSQTQTISNLSATLIGAPHVAASPQPNPETDLEAARQALRAQSYGGWGSPGKMRIRMAP